MLSPSLISDWGSASSSHGPSTLHRTELSDLESADYHLFDKAMVLDQVMRHAGVDTEQQLFRDLLLRLRDGQMMVEDWKHLMKQPLAVVGATTPFAEALHLFATTSDVAEHNIHKLHASGQPVTMLKDAQSCPQSSRCIQGYM